MDPNFYSSPAPSPTRGNLGLLQVSCPSLEVGGGPHVQHFRQLLFPHPPTLPAQHCSPAVELRVPSTGTDLPKAEHHSPLSPPHGRNPQHWCWTTVSHALHFTHTALSSQQCQVYYEESQSLIFCVCFYQIPSFLPTPNLLAGTKSLNPWNVIPTNQQVHWNRPLCHLTVYFLLTEPPLRGHTMVYACLLCLNTTR